MIACVTIPYFAANVERRADQQLVAQPLVLGGTPWEPMPVYAYSQEVARRGVRPGMLLRQAHVIAPSARFLPAAPHVYESVATDVTDVLLTFSHLIEPYHLWKAAKNKPLKIRAAQKRLPARYNLDLTGLPTKEMTGFAQEIGRSVRAHTALAPAIGMAQQPFTANIAASLTRPGRARAVSPAEETAFLTQQSIDFLPLSRPTKRRLRQLGVRTIGGFANLPAHQLHERFGAEATAAHKLATQEDKGTFTAEKPPQTYQSTVRLEEPLDNLSQWRALVVREIKTLYQRLSSQNVVAQTITAAGRQPNGEVVFEKRHTFIRPTQERQDFVAAVIGMWPKNEQGDNQQNQQNQQIEEITITIADLQTPTGEQLALFSEERPFPTVDISPLWLKYDRYLFQRTTITNQHHPLPEERFQLSNWLPV